MVTYATFLQCSNDGSFAAEVTSQVSSRSTSPKSPYISPEELAPERSHQPNLLLQAMIHNEKKYRSAALHKPQWKWRISESIAKVLCYASVTIFMSQAPDNFNRFLAIVPGCLAAAHSFILACEIKHFNTCKRDMHEALQNAANYCTDAQIEELKKLSCKPASSLSFEFVRKIENHRNQFIKK